MNEIIPIRKKKQEKHTDYNLISAGVLFGIGLLVIGVATATKKVADWGAEHQIVKQRIIDLQVRMPFRIEEIKAPEPVKELVVLNTPFEDLSSTEQKIIKIWKDYKTAMIAIAIFECGESGLVADAVSSTGDLGVAQINWKTWKDEVFKKFGYTAIDMFNVDRNLEVAYWIWDRGDKVEGNGEGSWEAWSGYKNGSYYRCFE
jgi:hypothetical protein